MANFQETSASYTIPVTSYETALCILPPAGKCRHVDSLRELYDKAYGRWPAHINLIYPFVAPEQLPQAQQQIQAQVQRNLDPYTKRHITLDSHALFRQRHNSTAILQESRDSSDGTLELLRSLALQALGHKSAKHNFHLTVGQTEDNSMASLGFLISKVQLLPSLDFDIGSFSLAILIRERTGPHNASQMRLWRTIDGLRPMDEWAAPISEYWLRQSSDLADDEQEDDDEDEFSASTPSFSRNVQPGTTFKYHRIPGTWKMLQDFEPVKIPSYSVSVASYNCLVDSEYPPARDRDSLLISTLLSQSARADVLVLQEVSDDFLSSLLNNEDIQIQYPFTSHGPPSQPDIGPLPSMRNVVILCKWSFRWEMVPFHRRHKGAVVADFDFIVPGGSLVVAGVHLTCGLTDGSVAAKKVQVQNLLNHLNNRYNDSSWVIAGDFNLPTSTYTIESALKSKSITNQTRTTLSAIEDQLSGDSITDAWTAACEGQLGGVGSDDADELFEGEEGATFDPRNNLLAAATSGTSQNRPQRYDRILVRSQELLRVADFNMFGLPVDTNGTSLVPSDHYGVRASLQVSKPVEKLSSDHRQLLDTLRVELQPNPHLTSSELERTMHQNHMFLTEGEKTQRETAFGLLEEVVLGHSRGFSRGPGAVPLVLVTVGSFALNVDTSTSDIDCLCIGSISSKTFFKLVRQRLQKAEAQGIRILRKVEASTGTMLELSVNGVPMDLQYCPASGVVAQWWTFDSLPASDPVFNLPILSLRKLKPYRDLLYLKSTLPDLDTFGLAYRAIKLWAVQRGIYSSKFGFLGGVHITLMLSWVYKRVSLDDSTDGPRTVSASDLVATFFHYYANYNWAGDMVFDAFFNKQRPRYHRSAREPMVVLGFHTPNSNVAHTSTLPGLLTLTKEFQKASLQLAGSSATWQSFFEASETGSLTSTLIGEKLFLHDYKSYVSIDMQFWGRTLAKGKSLVGWVESRCISLVVDIHKAFPSFEVRLWPARFTDNTSAELEGSGDYHGCYLIGLRNTTDSSSSKDERQAAKQSLEKIVDKFLSQLRTDEKNYDASTSWVNATLVTHQHIQAQQLRLDDREWGDYAVEIEPDSDDEEELDELDDEDDDSPKLPIRSKPNTSSTPVSTAKLRPASDVLNRLRWDPNLDPADYIIGYEDRFLGAKETGLEKWKTEQTDEEFIPQHRILYFRKKFNDEGDGKGETVWERATRIDRIFGSGAGSGA